MMVGNLEEEEVEEDDSVEQKKDVEEARVKVIRAGLDAMIVERLDILQMSVQNGRQGERSQFDVRGRTDSTMMKKRVIIIKITGVNIG